MVLSLCLNFVRKNNLVKLTRTISGTSDANVLSMDQIKFYQDNGYVIIKQLVDSGFLNVFKNRFIDICNGNRKNVTVIKETSLVDAASHPEKYIYKVQDVLHDEVFRRYYEDSRILNVVSQFIGENITAINPMLINKPPGSAQHPPHQDLYYFPCKPGDKMIGVWTAIDPANRDNGCVFVVPGSHISREIYNHKMNTESKKFFHSLVDEETVAPAEKWVFLEMNPGDTLFFHLNLIHGSGPNDTKSYRKSMVSHYANNNCHFVDFKGTMHENVAVEYENAMKSKGIASLAYVDLFKLKLKLVSGEKGSMQM